MFEENHQIELITVNCGQVMSGGQSHIRDKRIHNRLMITTDSFDYQTMEPTSTSYSIKGKAERRLKLRSKTEEEIKDNTFKRIAEKRKQIIDGKIRKTQRRAARY